MQSSATSVLVLTKRFFNSLRPCRPRQKINPRQKMDNQTLINLVFALGGGLGGWVLNSLSRSIIRIEDRISEIPLQYVTRDDYRNDINEIKGMLGKIFDKLDNKVDK
jgi:hypothetical protein